MHLTSSPEIQPPDQTKKPKASFPLRFLGPPISQPGAAGTKVALMGKAPGSRAPSGCHPRRAAKYPLQLRRKEERADPNGFSRAAADAVGVGGREALGCSGPWQARSVWSAAACCRFVPMPKQRAWNQIGMTPQTTCLSPYQHPRGPPQTSPTADWNKGQCTGHAAIRAQNPNNVPVTLSNALPPMQWALVGAKRLECGSLLPLCFYAETTCLEPDRHDTTNNVSVPISAPWSQPCWRPRKQIQRN